MSFFKSSGSKFQVPITKIESGKDWYANIDSQIRDDEVIDAAVSILNATLPQKYGPNGGAGYSMLEREYFLNLLLYHFEDYKFFPSGYICITDEWVWTDPIPQENGFWKIFKPRRKGRNYYPASWIKVPFINAKFQRPSLTLMKPTNS
jgi:hypothetical protein